MIELKVEGQAAELSPDTSIEVTLVNPLFNEDNLSPGSYSMPFNLPGGEVSPQNAAIFKNPDVIENAEGFVKKEAQLFFDGVPFRKGKIRVKNTTGRRNSAHFTFGLGTLSDEFKTKKLRDLLDEEIVISNSAITKRVYLKPNPVFTNGGFTRPQPIIVNGKTYDEMTLTALRDAINDNQDEPRAFAVLHTEGVSPQGLTAPFLEIRSLNTVDPFTELHVDIDSNFHFEGDDVHYKYEVHGDLGAYYEGFWTFLEGYFTGTYPDDRLRFPAVFNANMLHNGVSLDGSTTQLTPNLHTGDLKSFVVQNRNSIHPFLRLKWVLDEIAEYFGFTFAGDFYESEDTEQMLIWNPNSLDHYMPWIGKSEFLFWKRSFNLADLVPDMTVVDFLRALQDRYNLAVYLDHDSTTRVTMRMRENIALDPSYSDVTEISAYGGEVEDLSVTGVKLSAVREEDDTVAKDDFLDIGDPETVLSTQLSALSSFVTRATPGGDVLGPRLNHPPSTDFKFRVFYYKGLVNNGVLDYPQAHINAVNYDDRFDLSGVGSGTSVYDYFWKRWIAYQLKRKQVPLEIDFPIGDLFNLDWTVKRRFDRNNYLIKQIQFSLSSSGISVCKAQLYTMV